MTAHFYCWEPTLNIDPEHPDFLEQLTNAQSQLGASSKLLDFVASLLAKYPDLTDIDPDDDDTPWATGPLTGEITGSFINFPVSWPWYDDELISFVCHTAHSHGLHCYDPQSETYYGCTKPRS